MRRFSIVAILALAVEMLGCISHKEQDETPTLSLCAPQQLYVSFESVTSRTSVQDDKRLQWSEGDEISYFPFVNSNLQYQWQSGLTTDEGYSIFKLLSNAKAEGAPLQYGYALYPYAEESTILSEGNVQIQLPEVQYYAEDSFGVGAAPMVAVVDSAEGVLRFRNVAGFLTLQLYGDDFVVKRIELVGNNDEKLSGTATVVASSDSNPKISLQPSAKSRVVLDCGEGVKLGSSASKATAFWFALPELNFSKGFTITIYDADGTPYVKSTSNNFVIERNTIQPMKALDVRRNANIDISEENGKVIFYLSERGDVRSAIGASEHDWHECTILVNDKPCDVEFDAEKRPYIRVEKSDDDSYRAVLLTAESAKWYDASPYEGVVLPCSQFDSRAKSAVRSFPMYATYTKANGRNLIFDYGFALLRLRLRGQGNVISARVESSARYDLAGRVAQVADDGLYKIDKGMNFVALNSVNSGDYAVLSGNTYRDFYLMIAPGDYSEGLRVSVCDTERKAAFFDLSDVKLEAGDVYTYGAEYKPNEKQIFYEGFDNCVWGGDVVRGSAGVGFSPDASSVGINSVLDRTGYEEALTMVAYNTAGTGFVQSNTWNDVTANDVNTSHQATDSYVASRYLNDVKYLFRSQEHPGYIAVGTANTTRGIYRSPMIRNMKGIGSFRLNVRFAMQAGFNGALLVQVISGGRIESAYLDGKNLELTAENYSYKTITSTLRIPPSQLSVAANVKDEKHWHTLELVVADAANGSRVDIRDENVNKGVHGIYVDSIEAVQVDEWERKSTTLRVLLWNIQNGMWADQHNNYDNFVAWVKKWDPDICIWCESESIYTDKTNTASSSKYLPDGWPELCKRYGHSYAAVGGNRDNYPQTVTSKYPIAVVQRITDTNEKNKPVSHGAGHFQVTVNGKKINIVSLHMWPQAYGYGVATADREASQANGGGDKYRCFEMQYIVNQTVNNTKYSAEKYWIFGGDTNARSRLDNWFYGYETNSTKLLTHDVLLNQTDLKDVIGCRYPGSFMTSNYGESRIDILYVSPSMYEMIDNAVMLIDEWLSDCKKSEYVTSFYDRSDHRPLMIDFDISK